MQQETEYDEMEEIEEIDSKELLEGSTEEKLDHILLNIQENFEIINQILRDQLKTKDGLINKLHEELEVYRQDKTERYIQQVLSEVILVNKNIQKLMHSEKWPEMESDKLRDEIFFVSEDIQDLLERFGTEAYETQPGQVFNGKIHKVHKVAETQNPVLDKIIKESVYNGYKNLDKVIIPESVIVYGYKA